MENLIVFVGRDFLLVILSGGGGEFCQGSLLSGGGLLVGISRVGIFIGSSRWPVYILLLCSNTKETSGEAELFLILKADFDFFG